MRAVLQRVLRASVTVENEVVGEIGAGIMALVGVAEGDTEKDASYIAGKIADLRIFEDEKTLTEIGGAALVVSQFTLLGDARRGRRPSWIGAASPEEGNRLYEQVVALLKERGITTATGRFRTHMEVSLVNDGPVTVLLDSRKTF
ncbi:MAG: D-aminoacyl-tRNA deacylase [Armatimonas sp.]